MKKISILTGSGFSFPAEVPGVDAINEMFLHLPSALALERKYPFFRPSSYYNEFLFSEFVEFYLVKFPKNKFSYEDLYDYVLELKYEKIIFEEFKKFIQEDANLLEYSIRRDKNNVANDFCLKINLLVKDKLELKSNQKAKYPKYDNLFKFLEACILNNQIIYFHTLNHDNLLEFLITQQSEIIRNEFCDGFSTNGSNYYEYNTDFNKEENIEIYTGNHSGKCQYIKLHGSIDNYLVYPLSNNGEYFMNEGIITKVSTSISNNEIYIKKPFANNQQYTNAKVDRFPNFLSGKKSKKSNYEESIYQSKIDLFKNNLSDSKFLILIGYGCMDEYINDIIIDCYLKNGKKVIFITKNGPLSKDLEKYVSQIEIILDGLEEYDFSKLINLFTIS